MPDTHKIGVVTVTYNSGQVLRGFLACAFKQTLTDFVLYAIDNASKDNSATLLSEVHDERLKLIRNTHNVGVAEGNNQGIRAALADGCETILLINNDTEFPDDLFARLYDGIREHQCDMTTGKMYYFDAPDVLWCAGGGFSSRRLFNTFHRGINERDVGQYEEHRRVTYTPTCCLLARRSVFKRVGLMDSKYFVYSDDVDFLYRCLTRDITLWYLPDAHIYHKVSTLTGGDTSAFAVRYMTRNRMYFLRKHRPVWESLAWAIHLIVYTAPLRLLRRRDSFKAFRIRCVSVLHGWKLGVNH